MKRGVWQARITYWDGELRECPYRFIRATAISDALHYIGLGGVVKVELYGSREAKLSYLYEKLHGLVAPLTT